VTTNQPSSLGPSEVGLTTAQMRAALPAGFGNAWGIVTALSYPLLNDPSIDFASTLATLVRSNKVFTFEPISQLEASNYGGATNHIDQASLAAVYTMIARAVGITDGVNSLKTAKISKYWKDSKQIAHFSGAVADHATLGTLKTIKANTPIGSQIVNKMRAQNLVILRGTYTPEGGGSATHYMLGTLYTKNPDNSLSAVIANDPWTGWQVAIDPVSKTVVTPNFPLADFKIDGYQPVTIN
jgi:hypothetical protein